MKCCARGSDNGGKRVRILEPMTNLVVVSQHSTLASNPRNFIVTSHFHVEWIEGLLSEVSRYRLGEAVSKERNVNCYFIRPGFHYFGNDVVNYVGVKYLWNILIRTGTRLRFTPTNTRDST